MKIKVPPPLSPLGLRQREVLLLFASGMSYREIAVDLGISYATVKRHMEDVRTKLGCSTTLAAAAKLRRLEHPR